MHTTPNGDYGQTNGAQLTLANRNSTLAAVLEETARILNCQSKTECEANH